MKQTPELPTGLNKPTSYVADRQKIKTPSTIIDSKLIKQVPDQSNIDTITVVSSDHQDDYENNDNEFEQDEQTSLKSQSINLKSKINTSQIESIKQSLQSSQKLSENKSEKSKIRSSFSKNLEKASKITEKYIPQQPQQVGLDLQQDQAPKSIKSVKIKPYIQQPTIQQSSIDVPLKSTEGQQKVAPIAQFRNFIPLNSTSIIQSHAEVAILAMTQKLIQNHDDVFEDVDFPCEYSSLFGKDYSPLDEGLIKDQSESYLKEIKEKIEWIDVEETLEEAHNMQFYDKNKGKTFYVKNMIQGYLKDREFLNALALVCSNTKLFEYLSCQDIQQYAENKLYLFRLYKNKQQKYVVAVDTKVPSLGHDSTVPIPCFSRTQQLNQIWLPMIEKAYAKLNGGYLKISGVSLREAICDLIGLEPEFIAIDKPENVNQNNMNEFLRLSKDNGSVIGFMQRSEINNQINDKLRNMSKLDNPPDGNRIYIFQDILEGGKQYVITDPWFQGPQLIQNSAQLGVYNISFSSLLTAFNCIVVVKDFPDEWRGLKLDINLSPSYGIPSSKNVGWVNNMQYLFQVGAGVPGDMQEVPFVFRTSDIKGVQATQAKVNGLVLFSAGEKEFPISTFNHNQLLYMSKSNQFYCFGQNIRDNFNYSIQKLGKKYYSIIPFTDQKGETSGTYITLEIYFANKPSQLNFKFKTEQILSYCLGDSDQEEPRILRDKITSVQLNTYNITSTDKLLALVPGMAKFIILINPNVQQILDPFNRIAQKTDQDQGKDSCILDVKLRYIQDNITQESLLGLNTKCDSDRKIAEQVQKDMDGIYDFSHFNMGDEGLNIILPIIIAEANVVDLRFAGNDLTDASITSICYQLDKAYHNELRSLDLSDNKITQKGGESILDFITKMKMLMVVNLTNNELVPLALIQKIQGILDRRSK